MIGRVSECQCSHRRDEHDEHGCKRRKCNCVPLVFCACGHDDFHHAGMNGGGPCKPCVGECGCTAFARVNPPVLCGVCAPDEARAMPPKRAITAKRSKSRRSPRGGTAR